jgi:hypothetical protein
MTTPNHGPWDDYAKRETDPWEDFRPQAKPAAKDEWAEFRTAFDPDAYLATKPFDPDAYLGQKKAPLSLEPDLGRGAKDIVKQLGAGLVTGVEAIPAAPAQIAHLAGWGLEAAGLGGNREALQQQARLRELIAANRGKGIANYLPEPETTAGEYARTAGSFVPGMAALGGSLGRNVATGLLAGFGSEAGGQAYGTLGRIGGALAGGAPALMKGGAAKAALERPPTPTLEELKTAAQQGGYRPLEAEALAIPAAGFGPFVKELKDFAGANTANTEAVYREIDKLKGKNNVGGLFQLRDDLRSLGGKDAAAADIVLPKVEAELDKFVPGASERLRIADQNYNAFKVGQRLDTRIARKERQAGGITGPLGDRLRGAANEELSQSTSRFLKPEDTAALTSLNEGTRGQDFLRWAGKFGGALPHTLAGMTSLATANPLFSALPFASMGARGLYNQSVMRQAEAARAAIAQRSPLYQQRLSDYRQQAAAAQMGQSAQNNMDLALRAALLSRSSLQQP